MLPDEGKLVGSHGNISAGGRYGVHAMELLINQILKLGGRRDRLEAKVFGGGNVLQGFMLSNVGQQNAEFIVEYLNLERIPIVAAVLTQRHDIEVVGAAADACEARDMIRRLDPDVVTLDVEMPRMNGLEFLDKLMRARPTPVVMISSATERGSEVTFRALELGAVDFVTKPKLGEQTPEDYGELIAEKIRAAKSARLKAPRRALAEETAPPVAVTKRPTPAGVKTSERIIVVGASTGGTEAIREFLIGMPP